MGEVARVTHVARGECSDPLVRGNFRRAATEPDRRFLFYASAGTSSVLTASVLGNALSHYPSVRPASRI